MQLSQAYSTIFSDMGNTLPMLLTALAGLFVVVLDAFKPRHVSIPYLTGFVLFTLMGLEIMTINGESGTAYFELMRYGGMAGYVNALILGSGALSVVLLKPYLEHLKEDIGEAYALILFSITGMLMMGSANSLVTIFVGLETMSICLYILTAMIRSHDGAVESALKYFLLGAFSTGFFLYGIALIYGATGTMILSDMKGVVEASESTTMFWAGLSLLMVGYLFKVGAAPFHMWTPDVYQGAPTPITGFMSTASKTAAFASLILVLYHAVPSETWSGVIAVVALITMVVGNLLALSQRNVKRMLAYSSIAHAGYVLVGLAAGTEAGYSGALFYMLVYTFMNVGAFGVISYMEWDSKEGSEQELDSLAGIAYKRPVLAWSMVFFMFSLAGFPPLGGFFGKVAVFGPAIDAGLIWLAVLGILTSAISAYYYLRVLVVFFMKAPGEDRGLDSIPVPFASRAVIVFCVGALIVLGVAPGIMEVTSSFFGSVAAAALP